MLTADDFIGIEHRAKTSDVFKLCASGAVVREGKVLVCTRSMDDDFLPGYSELPGGSVDSGETLWEGLHREMQEETGLTIDRVFEELPTMDYRNNEDQLIRQCTFLVSCTGEPMLSTEHTAFHWIGAKDAELRGALLISEKQAKLIDAALAAVKKIAA